MKKKHRQFRRKVEKFLLFKNQPSENSAQNF